MRGYNTILALGLCFTLAGPSSAGDFICDDWLSFTVGTHTYQIPYCHNFPIDEPNCDVTRVIVAIHGAQRTARTTYNDVLAAAQAAGADQTSLIIAPQFLNQNDIAQYELPDDILFWTNNQWRLGDRSANMDPRPARVSSYALVDELLNRIADCGNFPNLSTVIVSGHSGGGQFSQHFAAGSGVENHLIGDLGLSVRYVTMNPGTLLYLDPARSVPDTEDFAPPEDSECPDDYNRYGYGLVNLNSYMAMTGADAIHDQYEQRQVIYILGELDTAIDAELDVSCPANLQGANRFERGSTYYRYLQYLYGPNVLNYQVRETVPGVGHNSALMYASSSGLRWLFDTP
jgi:hypothetical protein